MNIFAKNRFFRTLMLYYTAILMLPILIFCGAMFRQIEQQNSAKAEQESRNKVQMIAMTVDGKFSEMDSMGARLSVSSWVKRVQSSSDLITQGFDLLRRRDISEELSVYNSTIRVTRDIALMLPQKHTIINQVSWWDEGRYLPSIGIRDQEQIEGIFPLLQQSEYLQLVPLNTAATGTSNNFFMIRNLSISGNPQAVVLFYIDGDRLRQYIMQNHGDSLLDFQLLQNGKPLFTMRSVGDDKEGSESYAETVHSTLFPWEYQLQIRPVPENPLNSFIFALAALFASLIVGSVAAYFLAKTSYRPVLKLLHKVGGSTNTEDYEFVVIEQSFNRLQEEKQEIEQLSQQYYDAARNNLLANLLWGYFNSDTIADEIVRFHLHFHESMLFQVVLIHDSSRSSDQFGFKQFILLKEYLKAQLDSFEIIETTDGDMAVILAVGKGANEDTLAQITLQLEQQCRQINGHALKIICGTPEQELIGISKSYQNAKELLSTPVVSKITSLNLVGKRYYYPVDWEVQIINQLKIGNIKVVRQILEELKKENLERRLPVEANNRVVSLIFETFVRIMEDTDLDIREAREEFGMILESRDAAWPWDYLLAFAKLICSRVDYFNNDSTVDTGRKILAYVEQNYCDSSLSLQKMADQYGLSVSAVSKIFKSTVKVNFSDYLQLLRVHRAKEHFGAGDTDVIEVARKVGYDNEITFKRAFQKTELLTPRKYVQQMTCSK